MTIDLNKVKAGRGLTERSACKRLATLASRVPKDQLIVELGAFRGRTTAWLAWGSEQGNGAPVLAVDPWDSLVVPEVDGYLEPQYDRGEYAALGTFKDFQDHLLACGANRKVIIHKATAVEAAERKRPPNVALLFHDALHTADAVEADLAAWVPHLAPKATVVLHDVAEERFGVLEGANRVLPDADFRPPKIYRWRKYPHRRGIAVYRRG